MPVGRQSPKLDLVFQQYGDWLRALDIDDVGALNEAIDSGRIREVMLVAEALHEQQVVEIAAQIATRKDKVRLVLIAGPSSSGKTTFSKRLGVQLLVRGLHPVPLEMDHYFVDRSLTPRDRFGGYLLLQLILPLGLYFGIGTFIFHWRMPAYQNRQFLVILPTIFLLVMLGLQWCRRRLPLWLGYGLVGGVSLLILAAAVIGLERYETITKSPEGLAVLAVRQRLGADDAVVSLQYYLSASAGFYLASGHNLYAWPQQTENGYYFDDKLVMLSGQTEVQPRFPLSAIRAHPSVWILRDWREMPEVLPILIQGCQITFQQLFGRFEILQLKQCQP